MKYIIAKSINKQINKRPKIKLSSADNSNFLNVWSVDQYNVSTIILAMDGKFSYKVGHIDP